MPVLPPLARGRSCEGCTVCCKLPEAASVKKPAQTWCSHCAIGEGCRIYDQRPDECRTFFCGWVLDEGLDDAWRPERSRMLVKFEPGRIVIHVDKDRKGAWRREPFLSQIRTWAQAALLHRGEVIIWDGADRLRIMPDGQAVATAAPRRG